MADKEGSPEAADSIMDASKTGSNANDLHVDASHQDLEKAGGDSASGEPLGRTVTAQDWTGPDDPENPLNWYEQMQRDIKVAVVLLTP